MEIRHAHRINAAANDGDMHFSGVAKAVGLPFVAELANAKLASQKAAVDAVKDKAENGGTIRVVGAWRLWFEHPAKTQVQGGNNPFSPNSSNPNHSFEIHPVSQVGNALLGRSFIPIAGFEAHEADKAFPFFEKQRITIKASKSGLSLRSNRLVYNYVDFEAELSAKPRAVADGFIVVARIFGEADDEEQLTATPKRLIFVGGTEAADKIKNAGAGDRIHVLGVPRIDLNGVLALVKKNGTAQFDAALPYEMIVVGVR